MLKALVKKELNRILASLSAKSNKKNGKNANKKSSNVGMIILWIFVFFSLAMAFMGICAMLGDSLIPAGFDWLYFSIVGIIGFILSVMGNGFTSSATIFKAKDNALLLSMPIPPSYILLSRLLVIAGLSLIYAIVPLVPAIITRAGYEGMAEGQLIYCLLLVVLSSMVTTSVSLWLGWIISIISNHIRHKSLVTVVLSTLFIGTYYYFNFNSQKYLQMLVDNSMAIGDKMQSMGIMWPVYQFGHAAAGNAKAFASFAIFTIVLFAVTYYVLSKSFIKIATTTEKTLDVKYEESKQEKVEMLSPKKTLIKKELKKFLSSPTYMMNNGLGLLFIVAASVVLLIKKNDVAGLYDTILNQAGLSADIVPIGTIAAILMLNSMTLISAPSISLEGKNLWILKSLPIDTSDIFYAKTYLGVYLAAIPTLIFDLVACYVLKIDNSVMVILVITSLIYLLLVNKLGLMLNLKYPKLDWTNEAVPIKQSLPVLIIMLGGWGMSAIYVCLYCLVLNNALSVEQYMGIVLVVIALCVKLCDKWLGLKGKVLFDEL